MGDQKIQFEGEEMQQKRHPQQIVPLHMLAVDIQTRKG